MRSTSTWIPAACRVHSEVPRLRRTALQYEILSLLRAFRLCALVLVFAVTLHASDANAQANEIGLHEALERALAHNPELTVARHRISAHDAHREQASVLPNPELGLQIENAGGRGDNQGFESAEATISLGWAIEPGTRRERTNVAQARSTHSRFERDVVRVDVAAETAQRFLTCLQSQAHLETTEDAVALSEKMVASIERQLKAGGATRAEHSRARAELATARLAREDVSHETSVAYHRLSSQWGETSPSFGSVTGDLLAFPTVVPYEELLSQLESNPELTRLVSEERVANAELRLAKTRRWPTLKPNLGARRIEESDSWAVVGGVRLALPIFDRNQGNVAASRAELSRVRASADALRVRTRTALFEIYEELEHSFHRAEILKQEVIPRYEESMVDTRRAFERGRYSFFEMRSVNERLLEARHELVEASTSAHRLVIALERLVGRRVAR